MSAFAMSEKQLQRVVVETATALGWQRIYHTFDSQRSQQGFPDLVCLRERVVFIELKTETGRLSPFQTEWLRQLDQAGAEVYVIRPRHLDALELVLRQRAHKALGICLVNEAAMGLRWELRKELAGS